MKITGLETRAVYVNRRGNWLFVLVHTDAGITGLGEASQSGNDHLVSAYLSQMERLIRDQDPFDIEHIGAQLRSFRSRLGLKAASAIEMALWDICGRAVGLPAYRLWGGGLRDSIRLYANINRGLTQRTPEGYARRASQAAEAGFTAIKCAPFDGIHHSQFDRGINWAAIERALECLRAVRHAVGDGVDLLVDAHARFNTPVAMQVSALLEEFDLFWFEMPVPQGQVEATTEIQAASTMPIAGGEGLFSRRQFKELLDARCLDVLMPDAKYCGGIGELRRVASLAETYGIPVAPHGPSGPVSVAAGVHAMLGTPNFLILEFAFGEVDWRGQLTRATERIVDGYIPAPEAPGLGIELDEETLERHAIVIAG